MNTSFYQEDLKQLEALSLRRSLKRLDSPQGREILLDGQKCLNFSSNDYLGLANDDRVKNAAAQAIEKYGLGSGASRLICGNMEPHEKLEEELASFKKTQSALVYSSGYMANTGIIAALADRHWMVFSDKLNHASIIDGILLSRAELVRYPHADTQTLKQLLADAPVPKHKLIVTDTVFSMDGDKAPLAEIVELARCYDAMVMVDEAHAFGVLGANGGGLAEESGLHQQIDVQMGTLSKAAGCFGAYVCGTKTLRDYLINKSRSFIYTTAMPAALAEAGRAALRVIRQEAHRRKYVMQLAEDLRTGLKAMGFNTLQSTTPIVPIILGDAQEAKAASGRLLAQGIFVQAVRPPTVPQGMSRLRVTVTAAHTRQDLERLLGALKAL